MLDGCIIALRFLYPSRAPARCNTRLARRAAKAPFSHHGGKALVLIEMNSLYHKGGMPHLSLSSTFVGRPALYPKSRLHSSLLCTV